ncbi:hypothetical protein [Ideonella sp. BN130291]|uniref:hypothetical protein n=1 Tax=Ideonella sp. BN130291 TaxID=3112940 RepID=UPI002E26198D|nr:hypothetical protein [Ideonella sp. BN130291]
MAATGLAAVPCAPSLAAGTATATAPGTTQGPSAVDAQFWATTERIGTPDAYRAYLAAFPNGFFARLAAAALAKAEPASAQPSPSPAVSPAAPVTSAKPDVPPAGPFPTQRLAKIAADPSSGAVTFRIGDVFQGPGPVTVGWAGAKKQLIVPPGQWVVLATLDHSVAQNSALPSVPAQPIPVASVALGRLDSLGANALLLATFNRHAAGSMNTRWPEAQACEGTTPRSGFQWTEQHGIARQCVLGRPTTAKPVGADPAPLWDELRQNLLRLDLPLAQDTPAWRTDMHLTGARAEYMCISRMDLGPGAAGSPARQAAMKAYADAAWRGFRRELEDNDLAPGAQRGATTLNLPE